MTPAETPSVPAAPARDTDVVLSSSNSVTLTAAALAWGMLLGAGRIFFPGSYKVGVVRTDVGFFVDRDKVLRKLGTSRNLSEARDLAEATRQDLLDATT